MEIEIIKTYHDKKKTKTKEIIYRKKDDYRFWHREDGPAYREFDLNGVLCYESYSINSDWHREDGPARIWYSEDGTIYRKEFWLNNKELTENEWLRETKFKRRLKGTLLENKY